MGSPILPAHTFILHHVGGHAFMTAPGEMSEPLGSYPSLSPSRRPKDSASRRSVASRQVGWCSCAHEYHGRKANAPERLIQTPGGLGGTVTGTAAGLQLGQGHESPGARSTDSECPLISQAGNLVVHARTPAWLCSLSLGRRQARLSDLRNSSTGILRQETRVVQSPD